jgi:hypothetical protein
MRVISVLAVMPDSGAFCGSTLFVPEIENKGNSL